MKKFFILLIAMLFLSALMFLSGCSLTPEGDLARQLIREKGAAAADTTLQNAEWLLCNGISAGAVRRAYGNDPKKADAYRTLCDTSTKESVILAPNGVHEQ